MFILSKFHVIGTNRNTRGIAGAIFCFYVKQFCINGFHCNLCPKIPLYPWGWGEGNVLNYHRFPSNSSIPNCLPSPNCPGVLIYHCVLFQVLFTTVSCSEFGLPLCLVPSSVYHCVLFRVWFTTVSCSEFGLPLCLVPSSVYHCVLF
jgi:hypothetical protein